MKKLSDLSVKIFGDSANKESMLALYEKPYIQGLTTNPSLMRQAGIRDYRAFCRDILRYIKDKPISFEVFSDDFIDMERQALEIASWGDNVYVKIPVMNTEKKPAYSLIHKLTTEGVKVNVTAMMTPAQITAVIAALNPAVPSCISVFAGRIADTGRDPVPLMMQAVEQLRPLPHAELIWASPRELFNIFQADQIGCHIITVTQDILKKLGNIGLDLEEFSLDTVKMFYRDAVTAGFML